MPTTPKWPAGATRFVIEVEALPGSVPAVVRLRSALKTLLRAFSLKAIEVREVPQADQTTDPATTTR